MPQTYESTITYGGLALPLDWYKIPLNIPNAAYFARNSVGRPPWSNAAYFFVSRTPVDHFNSFLEFTRRPYGAAESRVGQLRVGSFWHRRSDSGCAG